MCLRVGCHNGLSPTEFVRLDVLLSKILDVLHCNQDSNVSVDLSLLVIPSFSMDGDNLAMFNDFEISLLFVIDFGTFRKFSF